MSWHLLLIVSWLYASTVSSHTLSLFNPKAGVFFRHLVETASRLPPPQLETDPDPANAISANHLIDATEHVLVRPGTPPPCFCSAFIIDHNDF